MSVSDDDWEDQDWNEDDSFDDDADAPTTVPCPACGSEIFDDTPRCPSCGHYLSAEDRAGRGKPTWIVVTALICLGVALWWVLGAW